MTTPRKTSTPTLVSALRILAGEIESPDGVANVAIGEGADRIEELAAELARVTAERDQFAECVNKSESVAERGNLVGEVQSLRARVAELEEKAERYRLTTLRQDARVAELEAEIERWQLRAARVLNL